MPPTSPTPVNRDEATARAPSPGAVRDAVRVRGDACPGALRLHAADDGALARLRLPAGVLTHRQAQVLADAAERLGDGHLDLTSRGNVQLRGLDAGCGGELAALLHGAGLLPSEAHERVRNIVASPLAGLDGLGAGDVQLWARRLDELLCASDAATGLSGRFLFALDDGRGDVAALGADVTLLARRDGTVTVRTGANQTGTNQARTNPPDVRGSVVRGADVRVPAVRVPAADAPRAALLAAEAFLTVARASGTGAWRVQDLPAESARGLSAAVTERLTAAGIVAPATDTGDAGDTAAPGPAPEPAPTPAPAPAPAPGLISSPGGTVALSAYPRLGRLSVAQWRLLLTEGTGLRLTPWRGVIVPGLAAGAAAGLLGRLRTAALVTDPGSPWLGVGACTGRPGCAKALADVRADAAAAVAGAAAGRGMDRDGLPVYWSGCERRCGHPQGDRVDRVATGEGRYTVSVHRGDNAGRTT
ncbi:cobalamin biosynthesis protein CobG [Streptomyces sp. NPDC127033]|uniref:cobalamin biosynthesis protein CobG n=1 Tax=Streptomyces sp. NPDC127033 TaxID=3347110 RepID=UPI0036597A07